VVSFQAHAQESPPATTSGQSRETWSPVTWTIR
jgi:hypothetical protein